MSSKNPFKLEREILNIIPKIYKLCNTMRNSVLFSVDVIDTFRNIKNRDAFTTIICSQASCR